MGKGTQLLSWDKELTGCHGKRDLVVMGYRINWLSWDTELTGCHGIRSSLVGCHGIRHTTIAKNLYQ